MEMLKYFAHVRQFIKCFKNDTHHLSISSKIDFVNVMILADRWNHQFHDKDIKGRMLNKYSILTEGMLKILYFHVMLDHQSLFFYKCKDTMYILEFFAMKAQASESKQNFVEFGMNKDFWIRNEDLLMRSKDNFSI